MAVPPCNRPFPVKNFIYLEVEDVGQGAVGVQEGTCSAFTKPMLIEALGATPKEKEDNFKKLLGRLEEALAQKKSMGRP
jgi:hypothetical protein